MKFALALLLALAFLSPANAGRISAEVSETVGLPGFLTFILSLESEAGESLRGFDANFTGPLNQVQAAGMDMPFRNYHAFFFVLEEIQKDSHFLFTGSERGLLSIGVAEDADSLRGAISGLANFDGPHPNPLPFARLVSRKAEACNIQVELAIDFGGTEPLLFSALFSELFSDSLDCVPEPCSLILASLGCVGLAAVRRSNR